jgi:short subunit dehydrogenase
MARIFITGSANGLGQLAARSLMKQGHKVVLHARNSGRAREAIKKNPEAESCLIGDLSNPEETKELAREVNKLGAIRCSDSQCRRLPGFRTRYFCRQYISTIYAYMPLTKTKACDLPNFRNAFARTSESGQLQKR